MAASPPPPQQPSPQANDDSMLLDDLDGDGESEDQLIDDDPAVPSVTTTHQPQVHPSLMSAPPSTRASPNPSSSDQKSSKRKRLPDSPSQVLLEKSAKKREQREREKEQQKYLLNKLIEIFEAGGGTCAVQQGQKKFPWVDLPGALIKIGCYFAGWPERCLPKMSDKHVDRIDASTGPSQWSLKQKRAMEAQINKGAVKVLPRPQARAVIFETIDDNGNIRDSTVDFSEEWVRHKLLGEPLPIDPVPRAPNRANYTLPQRRVSADMAYTANPNVLPPIRHHHSDHPERLELPSFASMNGMHTPDNGSRSPSPYSNFSDHGRLHSLHPSLRPTHGRSSYPTPTSQDEYIPTRGRVLTLEHGLPRTAVSMRSTSRHTSSSHGYPPMLTNHHPSHLSMLSRPPSPHSNNHSVATPTSPSISPENITQPPHSGAPSPTSTNGSSVQRFPSHVPNIPSSVVAWDAPTRSWILKLQHDAPCTSLPCRPSLICWDKGRDEWELRPTQPEPGRIIWNRSLGKWQFLLPESSGELVNGFSPMFPTHFPEVSGACIFDPDHTRTWIYTVYPEAQSSLPVSSCTIEWDRGRRLWALYPDPPQAVDVSWSVESKAWHFAMKPAPNHTSPEQLPPPALCPVNSNPTSRQQPSMIETQ